MSVAGATYMFGLYSNQIKTSLSYDQTTLNLLSFFKDLGANVGVISGLINEITPPWVVLLTACLLMVLIIVQNKFNFSRIEYISDGVGVIFLLLLPLVVVFREEFKFNKLAEDSSISQLKVVTDVPLQNVSSHENEVEVSATNVDSEKKISCLRTIFKPPNRGEDYTILQALFSIDMLILFLATTFGVGGTLTAIDNLGQIGHSLGYPNKRLESFIKGVYRKYREELDAAEAEMRIVKNGGDGFEREDNGNTMLSATGVTRSRPRDVGV
ncbi:protein NUCLEAR FUSION DEFECTIVE [Trifolium repens]|nr:protein NUCLEAR FUSION DEFECTIVE [Trifolium repens]